MNKPQKVSVNVKGTSVAVLIHQEQDFISLKDIAFEFASWISVSRQPLYLQPFLNPGFVFKYVF